MKLTVQKSYLFFHIFLKFQPQPAWNDILCAQSCRDEKRKKYANNVVDKFNKDRVFLNDQIFKNISDSHLVPFARWVEVLVKKVRQNMKVGEIYKKIFSKKKLQKNSKKKNSKNVQKNQKILYDMIFRLRAPSSYYICWIIVFWVFHP